MKLFFTIILSLLILTACSLQRPPSPAITSYYIDPTISPSCAYTKSNKTIRITLKNTLNWSTSRKIFYTKADLTQGAYLYSRWSQSPNDAIKLSLYTYLKQNPLFKEVLLEASPLSSDINLDLSLLKFEHYFFPTHNSQARVVITAELYRSQTKELLGTKTFTALIDSKTDDAQGGINAFNSALSKLLSEILCWSRSTVN